MPRQNPPPSDVVTGGDAHDHSGGDGAQIAYSSLSGTPTIYNQAVEDEGTPVTQRSTMNFVGAGVSVADTGSKTTVTISGGEAFPVGSVFISTVSTNPGTLLGYGTWSALAEGQVLVGYKSGDADFGTAGSSVGAKTVSSAGSVAAPTISGSTASGTTGVTVGDHAAHTHSVTSNVSVAAHTVTQPTIAWPAGVPTTANESSHTHSVTSNVAVSDHASHTHTYTDVPNHTHPHNMQGGTTGSTTGTNVMGSTATGGSSRAMAIATSNPTGGVATGTTAGPSATLTHSVTNNAVTSAAGSAHNHTVSWPAGVPTASGAATDAHSVTNAAVTSGNPSATLTHSVTDGGHTHGAGTLAASAPAFTGSATSVIQPSLVVYIWSRTA